MPKSAPALTIRRLTTGDTELLYDFFQSASERTRFLMSAHRYDRETAERLTSPDEIGRSDLIRFAAVTSEGGAPAMAGYLFFWDWNRRVPWLGIAVGDRFHGCGIGARLMGFAADQAQKAGKGGILLTTKKVNEIALAMYLKCGYRLLGEYLSDGGEPAEHLLMLNFPDDGFEH
ncbi:MAG: GNAT family N-acetyltransferase [Clostridiales bacterium]|nr:GNAT family N-acetyltransferase [Clostridiales bacterium]